ncbi:DUF4373 domain-containing protein [Virgibacillus salexigens]|uniref:Lin1244/Lin1753-like N-terminal domain-containing protein n=1 Tax=Virgibacillus kapii TaxID=1638645 RepID=A0ABQ2D893_9BACI|nr:DUF4373 domain-containing protein [Virgibacillus kapii]GGJ48869.1 hypothetical protein GCM10007111_08600 [Virgibacillus kapii]
MAKETYYFSHDANARNDEKILMLRADHGWTGYGVYWALLEMMFENSDTKLSHDKIKGIAVSYNIDITVLKDVINTCISEGLFVSDGDKFWSESLINRKSKYLDLKKKKSEAGKKGMQKRWAKQQSDNTVITDDNKQDNSVISENNKGKESKGNKSKVNKKRYHDNVLLTDDEYKRLVKDYGTTIVDSKIEDLDNYIGSKGKRYKDHNKTLRMWLKKDVKNQPEKKGNDLFSNNSVELTEDDY